MVKRQLGLTNNGPEAPDFCCKYNFNWNQDTPVEQHSGSVWWSQAVKWPLWCAVMLSRQPWLACLFFSTDSISTNLPESLPLHHFFDPAKQLTRRENMSNSIIQEWFSDFTILSRHYINISFYKYRLSSLPVLCKAPNYSIFPLVTL